MSLHRPHRPRQLATLRATRQQRIEKYLEGGDCDRRSSFGQRPENTRQGRIRDLLRHVPAFAFRSLRLAAFVSLLLPAFAVFLWHYVTCDRITVYYGNRRDCLEREGDDDRDDTGSRKASTNVGCDGVGNGGKKHELKDPFFSRHYMDIYGSRTPSSGGRAAKKPVVVFLTGGAWIIGYRMWGALLGRALAPFGILVVVPDYRNFPRVSVEGMVRDIDMSIQWVFDHVEEYAGDREKVVLVGQSAGAHIGGVVVALKVLDWLHVERRRKLEFQGTEYISPEEDGMKVGFRAEMFTLKSRYTPQELCGFISTSAPNNLVTMRPVFHRHGLSVDMQTSIFGGLPEKRGRDNAWNEEDVFEKWSPYHLVAKAHSEYLDLVKSGDGDGAGLEIEEVYPRLCVIHGTADKTVPLSEAVEFISLLSKSQIPAKTKLYSGWSHTDPILEAPMRGDHLYHRDIYELVCAWTSGNSSSLSGAESRHCHVSETFDERHPMLRPICPSALVEAARFCNPF